MRPRPITRALSPFVQSSWAGCSQRAGSIGGERLAVRRHNNNSKKYSATTKRSMSSSAQPVIEIREDFLAPQHARTYFEVVSEDFRVVHPPNLRFLSRQELGGDRNVATRAYYYEGGLAELQEQEILAEENEIHHDDLNVFIQSQHRSVYVEAPLLKEQSEFVIGLGGNTAAGVDNDEDCILELRKYHLKLGYDMVPNFLDLYGAGLPSKLHASGTDTKTSLVTLLYSEVGRLNEVIEVWRHGNGIRGMERSRVAARTAHEWRNAIASIADLAIEFRSTIHRPVWTAFSPKNK